MAEMKPAPVAEREPPTSRRRGAEEMAHLVVSAAEPMGRCHALEAPHGSVPALDAAMILLEMIVEVAARPMPDPLAKLSPDGARIGIMAVGGHSLRRDPGNRSRRGEERLGGLPDRGSR